MTYLPNQGQSPDGKLSTIPVGGSIFDTITPLGSGQSISTGWIDTKGYGALLYILRSDKESSIGGITVEYSKDANTVIMGGSAGTYTEVNQLTQTALVPKARYTRITYTNGSTTQTSFYFEVKLSTTLIQPTENSINKSVTPTNLALITKGPIEADDGSGSYAGVTRTGTSLNVHVDNPSSSTVDTTLLAKNITLTDGSQKTQVTNFPTIQPVSGTVGVNNTDYAKDVSLTNGNQKTQVIGPTTASVTTATTLATVTTVLPANPNRRGASFFSVTGTILIKLGAGASTTNYTARVVTNGLYELQKPVYTGVITAIGAGTLNVTEETV